MYAPVHLLTSASPARRTLGLVILIGAVVPTTYGVGAFGAASILGTFVGVEKLVTQLLADQDWSAIDELADSFAQRKRLFAMQAALFGTVPAILQNLGFDAIHVYEGRTGEDEPAEQASFH